MTDDLEIRKKEKERILTREKANERARKALHDTIDINNEQRTKLTLKSVLGGDMLNGQWFRKYIFFIVFCVVLTLIFVSNRYAYDNADIEQKHLNDTLQDRTYKLLTAQNQITANKGKQAISENTSSNIKQNNTTMFALPSEEGYKE